MRDEGGAGDTANPGGRPGELSVSQVTRLVRERLESTPELTRIWVRGEASNVRLAGSGHLYFTLKDEQAQLRVAYFAYSRGSRKPPQDGTAYLVHGSVRVYEKQGEYQLLADDLLPVGKGGLAERFEALKRKLAEEGLFDEARKAALPAYPRCIAIVTGLATAALQDVLKVLSRRAPYLRVIVFPAGVQGDSAPAELVAALGLAEAHGDVEAILLVRGGGSLEDLWCFNDEGLARCIAGLGKPVICGVGHEIDFTIADFVADLRAPTPSAAAELCAPDAAELRAAVRQLGLRGGRCLATALEGQRADLGRLFDRRLLRDVQGRVEASRMEVDTLGQAMASRMGRALEGSPGLGQPPLLRMAGALGRRIEQESAGLWGLRSALLATLKHRARTAAGQSAALEARLRGLDPRAPLSLGFALVWQGQGEARRLVREAGQVPVAGRIDIELRAGGFRARREEGGPDG